MTLGLLDLSIVTDRLLKHLSDSEATSNLWFEEPTPPVGPPPPLAGPPTRVIPVARFAINFTGLSPHAVRNLSGCSVSLYLFHITPDKFHRNVYPLPDRVGQGPSEHLVAPRARTIPEQPLALTLYYLLSAHSENYIEEQQAMSIALKCFHEQPIVSATVPRDSRTEEFTLTMEPESVDEIGRLWQSMSSPLRLSVVYRASVIFLEPETVVRPPPTLVTKAQVKAYPQSVVTRAKVDSRGLATITGGSFAAASIIVQIDGVMPLHITTANPPEERGVHVVSPTILAIQLPRGTPKGPYLIRVQLDRTQPAALFTLDVLSEVPP